MKWTSRRRTICNKDRAMLLMGKLILHHPSIASSLLKHLSTPTNPIMRSIRVSGAVSDLDKYAQYCSNILDASLFFLWWGGLVRVFFVIFLFILLLRFLRIPRHRLWQGRFNGLELWKDVWPPARAWFKPFLKHQRHHLTSIWSWQHVR